MMIARLPYARFLIAALAPALFAGGCGTHSAQAATGAAQALPVTARAIEPGTLSTSFSLMGTVVAARQADLASVASGTIESVDVQIGDRVTAGQLLVQIDDSTLRAELDQDEAALAQARARLRQTSIDDRGASLTTSAGLSSAQVAYDAQNATMQRDEQLFRQGYISQSDLDQARSALASARSALQAAQVAAANADMSSAASAGQADVASMAAQVAQDRAAVETVQTQIAQAAVRAPFDGIVTQRNVDPGSLASPGTQLVQVSELDPAYVDVGIPDGDLRYVRPGTTAAISIEAVPGAPMHGTVENLNAATGAGSLTYLARIRLANPEMRLRAGMVAQVSFTAAHQTDALVVPREALFSTDAGSAIYVVDGGKAKVRQVTVVLETQTVAQIRGAGIRPGTVVITERPDALGDESPVKVVSLN
jgi:HlyD family secretion protein